MDSLKNNIVFQSINTPANNKQFLDNLSSENLRFSYKPSNIDPKTIEENYKKIYGEIKFSWQKKIGHIAQSFYDGTILNIVEIFKILKISLLALKNFTAKNLKFSCEENPHFTKRLQLEIYQIGLNLILSLGSLYSCFNERKGRIFMDAMLLEKVAYDYRRGLLELKGNVSALEMELFERWISDGNEENLKLVLIVLEKQSKNTFSSRDYLDIPYAKNIVTQIFKNKNSSIETPFTICLKLIDQIHEKWKGSIKYNVIEVILTTMAEYFSKIEDQKLLLQIADQIYQAIDRCKIDNGASYIDPSLLPFANNFLNMSKFDDTYYIKPRMFLTYHKIIFEKKLDQFIIDFSKKIKNKREPSYLEAIFNLIPINDPEYQNFYINLFVQNSDLVTIIDDVLSSEEENSKEKQSQIVRNESCKKILSSVFDEDAEAFNNLLKGFNFRYSCFSSPDLDLIEFIHEEAMRQPKKLFGYYIHFFNPLNPWCSSVALEQLNKKIEEKKLVDLYTKNVFEVLWKISNDIEVLFSLMHSNNVPNSLTPQNFSLVPIPNLNKLKFLMLNSENKYTEVDPNHIKKCVTTFLLCLKGSLKPSSLIPPNRKLPKGVISALLQGLYGVLFHIVDISKKEASCQIL